MELCLDVTQAQVAWRPLSLVLELRQELVLLVDLHGRLCHHSSLLPVSLRLGALTFGRGRLVEEQGPEKGPWFPGVRAEQRWVSIFVQSALPRDSEKHARPTSLQNPTRAAPMVPGILYR